MLETLAIVQAPVGQRGAKPWFRRQLGGKTLLEWVVRRITDCQRASGVIVLAGSGVEDRQVAQLVPPDVPVFFASQGDPLSRFVAASEAYPSRAIVRVSVDHPFVDPVLIDRLITTAQAHPQFDYISFCSRDGKPIVQSPLGVFAEWFKTSALREVNRLAVSSLDRQQVTRYMLAHPERFPLRLIPVPGELDLDEVRLTIDDEEDWEHLQEMFDALGTEALDWPRISQFLKWQPGLRSAMARRNRVAAR